MTGRCRIIGVLDNAADGLTSKAISHIEEADLVIGGARTLALFNPHYSSSAEIRDLGGNLSKVPGWIKQAQAFGKKAVVLATGDPLCHGIGQYLLSRVGREYCEVLPNLSTIQLANARLGLSWQDVKILSIHSKDAGEWIEGAGPEHGLYLLLQGLKHNAKVAVFTSPANSPDRIARMLVTENMGEAWRMAVVEKLLLPDENVIAELKPNDAAERTFNEPNVVLLWRTQPQRPPVLFGLADATFKQRKPEKGLITKREVRAVSLARMQLRAESIVWDIGAGSGSVGLEAARLCPLGHVYAIEKNAKDIAIALENRRQMGVTNHTLIHGKAPHGLHEWPDPGTIFMGGTGGALPELIRLGLSRLKEEGWLVMNFITLENLTTAVELLKSERVYWDVTQLQASRSRPLLQMHRLAAENPVWIVSAQREE